VRFRTATAGIEKKRMSVPQTVTPAACRKPRNAVAFALEKVGSITGFTWTPRKQAAQDGVVTSPMPWPGLFARRCPLIPRYRPATRWDPVTAHDVRRWAGPKSAEHRYSTGYAAISFRGPEQAGVLPGGWLR